MCKSKMLNQNVTHINPTIQLHPNFDIQETGSIYRFWTHLTLSQWLFLVPNKKVSIVNWVINMLPSPPIKGTRFHSQSLRRRMHGNIGRSKRPRKRNVTWAWEQLRKVVMKVMMWLPTGRVDPLLILGINSTHPTFKIGNPYNGY